MAEPLTLSQRQDALLPVIHTIQLLGVAPGAPRTAVNDTLFTIFNARIRQVAENENRRYGRGEVYLGANLLADQINNVLSYPIWVQGFPTSLRALTPESDALRVVRAVVSAAGGDESLLPNRPPQALGARP